MDNESVAPAPAQASSIWGWMPWVLYFVATQLGHPVVGAIAGLSTSGYPVASARMGHASVKMPELAALTFFAMATLAGLRGGFTLSAFTNFNIVVVWIIFTVAAWGSILLGAPFTIRYARETTAPAVWQTSLFLRTNLIITMVFAAIFTSNLMVAIVCVLNTAIPWWIAIVYPIASLTGGFVFSNRYAALVQRRVAVGSF